MSSTPRRRGATLARQPWRTSCKDAACSPISPRRLCRHPRQRRGWLRDHARSPAAGSHRPRRRHAGRPRPWLVAGIGHLDACRPTGWRARGLRAVAYDRRGHAGSDKPRDGYDFDTLAAISPRCSTSSTSRTSRWSAIRWAPARSRAISRATATARSRARCCVAPTTPFALKTADNPEGIDAPSTTSSSRPCEADPPAYLAAGAPGFFGRGAEPEHGGLGLAIACQASLPRWSNACAPSARPTSVPTCAPSPCRR